MDRSAVLEVAVDRKSVTLKVVKGKVSEPIPVKVYGKKVKVGNEAVRVAKAKSK